MAEARAEPRVVPPPERGFAHQTQTLIVGAGAGGLVAALAAAESGQDVLVLERDRVPSGSTAMSAGLIPAAGTEQQSAAGIEDSPALFEADILKKSRNEADPAFVDTLAREAPETISWLVGSVGLPFTLVDDFDYPGHSRRRMHGLPERSGAALVDRLRQACEDRDIPILCERTMRQVCQAAPGARVEGVVASRPDGEAEAIGCERLILACNGYGGNPSLVAREIPDISGATYHGHAGNQGDALLIAEDLGLETAHLGSYQGHGNLAHPHGILITWAVITEGGVQLNASGRRFWNETQGYSEAARMVLAQDGQAAVTVFDERIAGIARQFPDFREAESVGAIKRGDAAEDIAAMFGLPANEAAGTLDAVTRMQSQGSSDEFGRTYDQAAVLTPPFLGVRVTGALFHTQGGIVTDSEGRVRCRNDAVAQNLFAVGGAAVGVSGSGDWGYLSGNGLLTAIVMGRLAGRGREIA